MKVRGIESPQEGRDLLHGRLEGVLVTAGLLRVTPRTGVWGIGHTWHVEVARSRDRPIISASEADQEKSERPQHNPRYQ